MTTSEKAAITAAEVIFMNQNALKILSVERHSIISEIEIDKVKVVETMAEKERYENEAEAANQVSEDIRKDHIFPACSLIFLINTTIAVTIR